MGAESGCLVFSSSRGDDAWCYCSLNACILPLHGFFFFAQSCFCSGFFLARCHSADMAAFNLWYFNLIARRT